MLQRLDYAGSKLAVGHISDFERDQREPPLPVLLRYAEAAGVPLEVLVDDRQDLPHRLTPGPDKSLHRIITALKNFDARESLLHHDELEVSLPPAFFRYDGVASDPGRQWEPVDVRLVYYHRVLSFSIRLAERSHAPAFTVVEHRRSEECVTEYRVAEDVCLSLPDARRLLLFLQDYFRCFYFSLKTKLPK